MKAIKYLIALFTLLIALPLMGQKSEPQKVKQIMGKVADWEIEHHDDLKYKS